MASHLGNPKARCRERSALEHVVRGNGTADALQLFGSQRGASIQNDYTHEYVEYIVMDGPSSCVRGWCHWHGVTRSSLSVLSTPSQCHPRGVTRSDQMHHPLHMLRRAAHAKAVKRGDGVGDQPSVPSAARRTSVSYQMTVRQKGRNMGHAATCVLRAMLAPGCRVPFLTFIISIAPLSTLQEV